MTDRRDNGFTLIELLMSITILTIIIGSISAALIVFLTNGSEAIARDDHSGGAGILAQYLDRDLASADTIATGSTTCSGRTNLLLLSWYEYSATASAPSPVPGAQPYRAAYSITVDPTSVPPGGGTRYRLDRTSCLGSTVLDTNTLVLNLRTTTSASAGVVSDVSCLASGSAATFTLGAYGSDTTSNYQFRSCTKARLTP